MAGGIWELLSQLARFHSTIPSLPILRPNIILVNPINPAGIIPSKEADWNFVSDVPLGLADLL